MWNIYVVLWSQVIAVNEGFTKRSGHSSVLDPAGNIYVIAGLNGTNTKAFTPTNYMNDIWFLNMTSSKCLTHDLHFMIRISDIIVSINQNFGRNFLMHLRGSACVRIINLYTIKEPTQYSRQGALLLTTLCGTMCGRSVRSRVSQVHSIVNYE